MKDKRSPLLQQVAAAKAERPDVLHLFRVGDFYEAFGADAEQVAGILGLTLTLRESGDDVLAMVGFPYHDLEMNLRKLPKAGVKVAIAELVKE